VAERFIKEESLSRTAGVIASHWRLFRSFRVFLILFPLTLATIVLSSAAPSIFRWYSGNFASGAPGFLLTGLTLITALAILFRISAWALFELTAMWSSQKLHADMVRGLARTRTTFFDENPSGRLINRLIRDYEEVRGTTIVFVGDIFNATIELIGIAVVVSLASPWASLLMLPLLGGFAYVQFYRSAMLMHSRNFVAIATGRVMGRKKRPDRGP
jgi:ABC-type multidrug transport system fused ATPase/permease subunit